MKGNILERLGFFHKQGCDKVHCFVRHVSVSKDLPVRAQSHRPFTIDCIRLFFPAFYTTFQRFLESGLYTAEHRNVKKFHLALYVALCSTDKSHYFTWTFGIGVKSGAIPQRWKILGQKNINFHFFLFIPCR